MSFKIAILVCLTLMCLAACIAYFLGKRVSKRFMKYIPVFSFGTGVLYFYIKFNFISHYPNSFERVSDMIAFIMLFILFSIALLEAIIIDIVENTNFFRKSFMILRNSMKLVDVNKEKARWK